MLRIIGNRIFSGLLLAAMTLAICISVRSESGEEMLNEYFDLIVSGNYESAEQFWTEESRRRATRFGIEYIDIPLKVDCSSPLVRNPEMMFGYDKRPISTETALPWEDARRYAFDVLAGRERLGHYYHTIRIGEYQSLLFPQDLYARGWPTRETKYLRILMHPEAQEYLSSIVLNEADRFIEETARAIGVAPDAMALLEREKLNYFFCHDDNLVRDITGYVIKGTYDLASDDIISAFFPHYHEMTHFLVNFKFRRLPLYTLPLLREGVAVHFGGRFGKSPTSLYGLGGYIYREGVVDLDSMLTMEDFERSASADLAYPLAGIFVSYVVDRMGYDVLFDLYREVSGSFDSLISLDIEDIQAIILKSVSKDTWPQFRADFDQYLNDWLSQKAGLYPGILEGGKTILSDSQMTVTRSGDWLCFTATFPAGSQPTGNLLFGRDKELDQTTSMLFEEQYRGGEPFDGYRFGVRFDGNEVGVYDYATSELLAKYIFGISPSPDYYNQAENRITFRIDRALVDNKEPSKNDFKLLGR